MRMVAILKNDDHPEYGEVSMPLPIKASEYSHCMELLSSLSIGDALNKDCKVEELTRAYPTLRCLEGCKVNIDELDYLAKRLDGFDAVEVSQFQAMADKLKLTDMKDLISPSRCRNRCRSIYEASPRDNRGGERMKRVISTCLTLCLSAALALPASALDYTDSGHQEL